MWIKIPSPGLKDMKGRHSHPTHLVVSLWNLGVSQKILPPLLGFLRFHAPTFLALFDVLPQIYVFLCLVQGNGIFNAHLGKWERCSCRGVIQSSLEPRAQPSANITTEHANKKVHILRLLSLLPGPTCLY